MDAGHDDLRSEEPENEGAGKWLKRYLPVKDAGRKRFCRGKELHSRKYSTDCLKTEQSGKESRKSYAGNASMNTRNGTIME